MFRALGSVVLGALSFGVGTLIGYRMARPIR